MSRRTGCVRTCTVAHNNQCAIALLLLIHDSKQAANIAEPFKNILNGCTSITQFQAKILLLVKCLRDQDRLVSDLEANRRHSET